MTPKRNNSLSKVKETREVTRKRLGITFFEEQVIRNFIDEENNTFISNLKDHFDIVILTNEPCKSILTSALKKINFKQEVIKVVEIEPFKKNKFYRFFSSLARVLNESKSNNWSRKRNYAIRETKIVNYYLKEFLHALLARSTTVKRLVRRGFALTSVGMKHTTLFTQFQLDLLVITSATNYYWDARIGNVANRLKIPTIAIPRSWDNLTSHGLLRFNPNKIIVFSRVMKDYAVKYQKIQEDSIEICRNPAYSIDGPTNRIRSNQKKNILYACMGNHLFRNEQQLINKLCRLQEQSRNFNLTILEHPKFGQGNNLKFEFPNVDFISFAYRASRSRSELYEKLSDQHLVLVLGSSVVLDSLFVQTPVLIVALDSEEFFWASANRYLDEVEHFSDLFNRGFLPVVRNLEQLESVILNLQLQNLLKIEYVSFSDFLDLEAPSIQNTIIEIAKGM